MNAKLTAHRTRQAGSESAEPLRGLAAENRLGPAAVKPSTSRIAAKVAERYAKAPTYSEVLAQEAARAAEVAAAAAQQAHVAAQAMLASFEQSMAQSAELHAEPSWHQAALTAAAESPMPQESFGGRWAETAAFTSEASAYQETVSSVVEPYSFIAHDQGHLAYRIDESSLPPAPRTPAEAYPDYREPHHENDFVSASSDYGLAELDLFADPVEAAFIEPAQPLPARIIEFPRELIAERKMRPRLEEGPLREAVEEDQPSLRIFEAEPQASAYETSSLYAASPVMHAAVTEAAVEPMLPEWHSLRLDSQPEASVSASKATMPVPSLDASPLLLDAPIYSASLEDRLMAGAFDLCLVGAGWMAFLAVFASLTEHLLVGKALLGIAGMVLVAMFAFYQFLFLGFSDATPGMRYAKLALCTFNDQNPSRKRRRRRVGAMLLAGLPMGLGYLSPLFDEDRLSWHDRMTGTYQRSYRE